MRILLRNAPPVVELHEAAPVRVSVAMMVGNEAHFIRDAIASASWADEIVVLDTGSTDGTDRIAAEMGAKVTREEWRTVDLGDGLMSIDDFASARNRSIELALGDWVVLLDADERFRDCAGLRGILEALPACVSFASMALDHDNRPELNQFMTRVFRKSAGPRYEHRVHETLETWARDKTMAVLPREVGWVQHLGGAHDTRAKLRRDERNWRIVQRVLADNPNDVHALSYAIETLSQMGKDDLAEPLAWHAWEHATELHPARHRIVLSLCEFLWQRGEVSRVIELLQQADARWSLNANARVALGLALWVSERSSKARAHLLAALESPDQLAPVMYEQATNALAEMAQHAA